MPRIRKLGHRLREKEKPFSEWTDQELQRERERVIAAIVGMKEDEDRNPWPLAMRECDIDAELRARQKKRYDAEQARRKP